MCQAVEQNNHVKLSIGIVAAIRKADLADDHASLSKLLNPALHRPGRKHVLSRDELKVVKEQAKKDGAEGRAWTPTMFRGAMARIANDGSKKTFRKGLPSASTFRQLRAENRDITVRNKVNKEKSKSDGEDFDHVQTLETVLQPLLDKYPYIATDPDLFWNMDE